MSPMPFTVFIDQPFSAKYREAIRKMAEQDEVRALTAYWRGNEVRAQAWDGVPDEWPDDTIAIWIKESKPIRSRTMRAVDLVLDEGMTVYAAAKACNVNQSAVHRAMARRNAKELCPCCGQVVREGFGVKIPDPQTACA